MFFLLRLRMRWGRRARCVVTHVRPDGEEVLEDRTVQRTDAPVEGERGWVIPANPQPGDTLRFELVEVEPVGVNGAGYAWDVSLCDINGPLPGEDARVFAVTVPAQTATDIAECPEAEINPARACKAGPRLFLWTIEAEAQKAA